MNHASELYGGQANAPETGRFSYSLKNPVGLEAGF